MDKDYIIDETTKHVRKTLEGEGTGHDWWHINRVYKNATYIGKKEKANIFVVELGALLHDIADWKFYKGDESVGPRITKDWLEKLGVNETIIENVCDIVKEISFKGAGVKTPMKTLEGMIVQDADRLDALGAMGIARAFAYGGHKGREFYNPDIKPQLHQSFEEYKNSKGTTINHFYEKLFLLKDLMNTKTGKILAEEKHKFMESFMEQFLKEWNVTDLQ